MDKGVIIEPGEQQSGLEVINEGGINKITIKNSYRRRVAGYIWRDAWEDTLGVVHDLSTSEPFLRMEIDPISGFSGTFSTIIAALTDGQAYEPVVLAPIELPYHPGARRTFFRFNALGVGLEDPDDPSAYTSAELADGEWMAMKCLVVDYFLPMLINAAGPITGAGHFDDAFGGAGMAGQLLDYINFVKGELPAFYTEATNGNWWGALLELWNAFLGNSTISQWTFGLVGDGLQALNFTADEVDTILGKAGKFFSAVGIVDVIGGFADTFITGYHIGECKKAEKWDITVTAPVLHIEPREALVNAYGTQLLTLVIDDDTGGPPDGSSYAYRWFSAGRHGTLVNPMNHTDTSNDFLTSSDFIQYVADIGTTGNDTIRCELMVTLGGVQSRIGDAESVLEVYRRQVVLPDSIYCCDDGYIQLTASLEPPFTDPDAQIWWTWTNLNCPGRLFLQSLVNDWTSLNNYAYIDGEGAAGEGHIRCIASVSYDGGANSTPVDTAIVHVTIQEIEVIYGETVVIPSWDWDTNSCGCRIFFAFTPLPGITQYSVYGYGFNDPYYYGTELHSNFGGPPWPPGWVVDGNRVLAGLSSGGGSCDPDDPPTEDDLCGWFLERFEGAIWEITPECLGK